MEISKDLRLLSEEFKKNNYTLYIIGGFVRDSLLGLKPQDIDLTSNAPYDVVKQICKELKFKCIPINKNLGTLKIISSEEYEYTQFRSESYETNKHSPDNVVFVDDINLDVLRRDITINSLYYNISEDRIVDLVHGQKDLENKIIRCTNHPSVTLQDDGLRILRIIRFASILNFRIEKTTYKNMSEFRYKLNTISKERILKELSDIVVSDLKYNNNSNTAIKLFNKLNLYKYIFNANFSKIKLRKSDMNKFYSLSKFARLIGLYVLILRNYQKTYMPLTQLKYNINLLLGREGIKESSSNIHILEKIYLIYQNLEYGIDIVNATINYLTLSNTEREIIDTMLNKDSKKLLSDNISIIKANNLPLGIHELNITPQDIIDNKIEEKYISKILQTLFNQVIEMKVANEKEDLIALAKNINETFISITNQIEGDKNENNILPPRRKSSQSKKTKKSR